MSMAMSNDSVYAIDTSTHRIRLFGEILHKRKRQKTDHSLVLSSKNPIKEQDSPEIDLISSLPDCMLSTIISHLPTKDAARTTILSSRWRNLWAFSPLNLDSYNLSSGDYQPVCSQNSCAFKDLVSHVLERHCGPVCRFQLAHICFGGSEPCLREWLKHLSRRGVQKIILNFDPPCHQLPPCLLKCKALRSLKMHCSWFPSTSEIKPSFTGLTDLTLSNTIISQKDLKSVLNSCQALQSLALIDMPSNNTVGFHEIEICSGSLKCLVVTDSPLNNICIEHAPNLERLLLSAGLPVDTRVKVVHAPKIEVLGFLEMGYGKFEFGGALLQRNALGTNTVIHSVKTLAISINFNSVSQASTVVNFLKCFPYLQTLHIRFFHSYSPNETPNYEYWNLQDPVDCLDYHLEKVTFQAYVGSSIELDYAKLLFSRAKVLKVLNIVPRWDEWTAKMHIDLVRLRNKVSPNTRVILATEKRPFGDCFRPDVTNLSVCDPFSCSMENRQVL